MTVDKRTAVLGAAAVGAVTAVVTAATVVHHSTGSRERRDVASYIDQVNGLQNQMHAPLARVMLAYQAFVPAAARRASGRELAIAARTLDRLDRRLAQLPAPPEARRLRTLLRRLVSRESAITREVQLLATFAPRYVAVVNRVRAAGLDLGSSLRMIKIPASHMLTGTKREVLLAQREYRARAQRAALAQADAVDAYDRVVTRQLARVKELRPPPALTPEYRARVSALRDVASAGAALAGALREGRRTGVSTLGRRFTLASRAAGTVAVQRAQAAAIKAYNRRAGQVAALARAVEEELTRLRGALP